MVLAPSISTLPKLILKPGRWTVGSAATCSYRIVGDGVCPRHALLLCGGQNTVLKAWDTHTWHNGQVVQGEVRLAPGDRVTLGSVEFSIEVGDAIDVPATPRNVPVAPSESHRESGLRATEFDLAKAGPEGWDLERLREQIHELREELSHRVSRRSEAVHTAPTEIVPNREVIEKSALRIAELEQAASEARQLAEQALQELATAKEEHAKRDAELRQLADDLRPALESSRQDAAELRQELDQLRSEAVQRAQTWERQSATWTAEREQWQAKLSTLANAQQQVAEFEQRHSTLFEENARWKSEYEQLRADSQLQQTDWASEREQWQAKLVALSDAQQQIAESERRQSELHEESARWQSECEQLRDELQLQQTNWATEREQWQAKLAALSDAQQQMAEAEQRKSELLEETARWKSECEQLRAGWQIQQATWDDERKHLQDESRRQEDAIQATLQAVTQREQEWAEQSQQLLAEREQFESERQQLQAEQFKREQVIEELVAERQRVEQQISEQAAKFAELSGRASDLESQQANLAREQQTLEHSWNWLNTDRRTLVEEKENWQQQRAEWQVQHERWIADNQQLQRDREEFAKEQSLWHQQRADAEQLTVDADELAVERKQFHAEQSAWNASRDQWEADQRTTLGEARSSNSEVDLRQQVTLDEPDAVLAQRTEWDENSSKDSLSAAEVEEDWKNAAASSHQIAAIDSAVADEPLASFSDAWSVGVDLTEQREAHAKEWGAASQADFDETTSTSMESIDGEAMLAERHSQDDIDSTSANEDSSYSNEVELRSTAMNSDSVDLDSERLLPTPVDLPAESDANPDLELMALRARLAARDATEPSPVQSETFKSSGVIPRSSDAMPDPVPTNGPVVSILESMAFAEDEDVDDSVSRYMQHLLARSQQPGDAEPDRYIPAPTSKSSAPANSSASSPNRPAVSSVKTTPSGSGTDLRDETGAGENENSPKSASSATGLHPVHQQDKNAIRSATEQMRQVANQQTVKNVEAANWKQIKQSIKTKTVLASISFVLSAGLLFWGYYFRPEFLILGVCASGLGIMTWLDLIIAVRQARARTSRLTGRSKKSESSKS